MPEIISYQVGGKAEQNIELLVHHLADWLEEEQGKNLIFHTFSNTCWLTYGAILEKFQKQDPSIMRRIRGFIVDSVPVAAPDPQDEMDRRIRELTIELNNDNVNVQQLEDKVQDIVKNIRELEDEQQLEDLDGGYV